MKFPYYILSLAAISFLSTATALEIPNTASNTIDTILAKEWKDAKVTPNPKACDETFLRRVYLDVTGRIPTYEEATRFLESTASDKRAQLIDELLDSEGYVNHFFNYWADILRINTAQPAAQNVVPYYINWVRDSLAENRPYDEFVRELVTARGQAWENGAIGYYVRDRGMPLDNMANTVRIFLGTRLECAQCHDHPFDSWSQMDFFHMAAFTYGVNPNGTRYGAVSDAQRAIQKDEELSKERKNELRQAMSEVTRLVRNNNDVTFAQRLPKLPHDYKYEDGKPNQSIEARTMFGADPVITKDSDRLQIYSDWMTSPENPRFTTVIANRLWKKLMGVGVYEPVDEFMESSAPSNAELMSFLEQQMIASKYDMKAFLRMILNTQTYQRETTGRDLDPGEIYHFTGPVLRRMNAEQIWDSMVALVNPTPEMTNWKRDQQFELRMANQQVMQDALACASAEDLVAHVMKIADTQTELEKLDQKLRAEIAEAKAAKDNELAQKLQREANSSRSKLREEVMDLVFEPVMREMDVEMVAMRMPNGESMVMDPMEVDPSSTSSSELRKLQADAESELIDAEMEEMGLTDSKQRSAYASFRKSASANMLRAAHLNSPAPLGHFLREFGQSDRDTIENANFDASVPQALQLLNGSAFGQIANSYSVVSQTIAQAETPEKTFDAIFLSVLTRLPSEDERKVLFNALEMRGTKIYQDTVFALLNGQEFWFVQ